jgi:hypothetical protein
LAEYYATLRFVNGRAIAGRPPPGRPEALRRQGLADLELLRSGPPETAQALAFYRASWAMVHVLLSSGVSEPPPEERWAAIHATAAAHVRRRKWPLRKLALSYSSRQTPRAISVSAAMEPKEFQAGSWDTFFNSGQALRELPSTR